MLPGFRFLFVAVVLSVSMLVFGLGAAALLRATHEEFASLPLKQIPEVVFATRPEVEQPTLAVLQVDAPLAEAKADQPAPHDPPTAATAPQMDATAAQPQMPDAITTAPDAITAAPDKVASLVATAPPDTGTIPAAGTATGETATDAAPSAPSAAQTAAAPATPPSSAAEVPPSPATTPAQPSADATPIPAPPVPAPAMPTPDATAAAAPVAAPAASPTPSDSISPAVADATVPADAKTPEPSNQPAVVVALAETGPTVTPDAAKADIIKPDIKSDAGIAAVAETMTSPFGENFRPPLPANRPTARIANLTLSAEKKPAAKPLVAKRKPHRSVVRRSRVARPAPPKPAANALFPGSPFSSN